MDKPNRIVTLRLPQELETRVRAGRVKINLSSAIRRLLTQALSPEAQESESCYETEYGVEDGRTVNFRLSQKLETQIRTRVNDNLSVGIRSLLDQSLKAQGR